MKRTSVVVTGLLIVALSVLGLAQSSNSTFRVSAANQPLVRKSAEDITAAQLRDYLSYVASDEMEGRDTPSRGLDSTAKFIATLLSRWGVKPAGDDGGYLQRIVLKRERVVPEATEFKLGEVAFAYGRDFLAERTAGSASGQLVFAGDGWLVKSKNRDPFKDIDPKGKIVIVTAGSFPLPAGVTRADLPAGGRGVDWMYPADYAKAKGAVGVIRILPLLTQADPDRLEGMRRIVETGNFSPEKLTATRPPALPLVYATVRLVRAMFAREKVNVDAILTGMAAGSPMEPFELSPDKVVSFSVKTAPDTASSQNVVGIVEGSDPARKHEHVALGAHYDHLGTDTPVGGDAIWNGADDDGSGTVALLAMAEALSKVSRRPKRSALFVWHMGEEHGLYGSEYFTTFPTVPLDSIVAQLNIDMIGRSRREGDTNPENKDLSGPNELYVIGSKMMSTELGALSEAVNKAYLKLAFNYRYDDPKDPERFFYRSDHIYYARKGIPIIFYFTGPHEDYHGRGDEVSKIDFVKYEKIVRTIYVTLWEIAELKSRPVVDKPLPAQAR